MQDVLTIRVQREEEKVRISGFAVDSTELRVIELEAGDADLPTLLTDCVQAMVLELVNTVYGAPADADPATP